MDRPYRPVYHTPDHPHTREHGRCPTCHNFKQRGLLVCWTCYRALGLRDACPPFVAAILDDTENTLTLARTDAAIPPHSTGAETR